MMHIASAADENYLPHCAAMLHSVLERHAGQGVTVHFLHAPTMETTAIEPVADMVAALGGEFYAHPIPDAWVDGLPQLSRIPAIMWYRIFLPQLLPQQDRVLYLDCDTLLVDDLMALWQTELEGYHLGAVANVLEPGLQDWPRQLGLPPEQPYFNSGVLLLNLSSMRQHDLTPNLFDYGKHRAAVFAGLIRMHSMPYLVVTASGCIRAGIVRTACSTTRTAAKCSARKRCKRQSTIRPSCTSRATMSSNPGIV